jgi:hypothetical protein
MQIYTFNRLIYALSELLWDLAQNEPGPRRKPRFLKAANAIYGCGGFSEVIALLTKAPKDKQLRKLTKRMVAAQKVRRMLGGHVDGMLLDWYACYYSDPVVTANIARMVAVVAQAHQAWVESGHEPRTGTWSDKQCSLLEELWSAQRCAQSAA